MVENHQRTLMWKNSQKSKIIIVINVPTYDVENANCTNKGGDLRFAKESEEQECNYIDQHIFKDSKTRRKNIAMAWIEFKMHTIWFHKAE